MNAIFTGTSDFHIIINKIQFLNFLFIKSWRKNMYYGFHKILSSVFVFSTDNIKPFSLSGKSAYLNDFWRIMWHLRIHNKYK